MRSVVYSFDPSTQVILNLNTDVLCMDGFVSYTISEYLEDRASDGLSVVAELGGAYLFSDGHVEILTQQIEKDEPFFFGMAA